jgi:D-lactate dehydrogenase (cytochrome)
VADLAALVGAEYVYDDAGALTVNPGTLDELSQVMALCHRAGVAVWLCGTGSASSVVGRRSSVVVSTRRLAQVHTYEPDDLTVGVGAGMTLGELRALLATNGQQLPLEVGDDDVTLGSLVATGADGPRRLGYGTLRDWTIALTVVEPDGTVVRLGAQVVKNVTGYDLVKLYVGSRGTLGVIATVSLKVFPMPRASATLVAGFPTRAAALAMLDRLAASKLQPTAAEIVLTDSPKDTLPGFILHPSSFILHTEGHPDAVARHLRELRAMAEECGAVTLEEPGGADEARLWHTVAALSAPAAPEGSARIRLCVAPADLGAALDDAHAHATAQDLRLVIDARALSGVIYLLVEGPTAGLRALFAGLATRWPHAQLLAAAPVVTDGLPIWGAPPPALDLMRELKGAIDPLNLMCPGGYVLKEPDRDH